MNISSTLRQALYAQETDKVIAPLLTFSHPSLAAPIRIVLNDTDVTSRGNLFRAHAFDVRLPRQSADTPGRGTIAMGNVDGEILDQIRALAKPPPTVGVLIEVIRIEDPDLLECAFDDLELLEVSYDALVIEGNIGQESFLRQRYPKDSYTPATAPGLF